MYLTTEDHLTSFMRLVKLWMSKLGITSYITSFERIGKDCSASIHVDPIGRSARFRLSKEWKKPVTEEEIERCAIHEVMHLLMAQVIDSAEHAAAISKSYNVPFHKSLIYRDEEAVVVMLENILFKESRPRSTTPALNASPSANALKPDSGY